MIGQGPSRSFRMGAALAVFSTVSLLVGSFPTAASASGVARTTSYYALGDSYSSGEGINPPPFLAGSDTPADQCHRSPKAYPLVAYSADPMLRWPVFLACSGAKLNNVAGNSTWYTEPAQITKLAKTASLVTLTVGGNDAGFAVILNDCIQLGRECYQDFPNEPTTIDNLLGPLYNSYLRLKNVARQAKFVVLTYPQIFLNTCLSLINIDQNEINWIRAMTSRMNGVIKLAASSAGVTVLDEETAFSGHEICSNTPWANGETLPKVYSFHPNASGQSRLGQDLANLTRSLGL